MVFFYSLHLRPADGYAWRRRNENSTSMLKNNVMHYAVKRSILEKALQWLEHTQAFVMGARSN